jgi:uncharacterized protein (DUF2267 family)
MAHYEEVIDAVRRRLPGAGVDEARQAVARTIGGLVLWLPREERPALRDALPGPLKPAGVEEAGVADGNAGAFVRFVAGREGREPELVRNEVRAVLSALAALEPDVITRVRRSLPDDFAELFASPAAGAGQQPADLDDERPPTRTPPPEREIDPRRPPADPVPGTSDRRHRDREH